MMQWITESSRMGNRTLHMTWYSTYREWSRHFLTSPCYLGL